MNSGDLCSVSVDDDVLSLAEQGSCAQGEQIGVARAGSNERNRAVRLLAGLRGGHGDVS
jgi:hypothetical protein